jgi:hypothetical protein
MAYDPNKRIDRMKELMKPIDQQIMMCDDKQDLLALASIMAVTAKNIYVQQIGEQGAHAVLQKLLEDI